MTDTETTLRNGLHALAEHVQPTPPPAAWIRAQSARRKPRRRAAVGVSVVAGIVAVGATAAATGTVPQPVRDAFNRFASFDEPFLVVPDDAELVASTTTPDGTVAEYWLAIATDGGRCDYVRYVDANGDNHRDGWSSCTHEAAQGSGMPGLYAVTSPTGRQRSVAGHAPTGTATMVVQFADGSADRSSVPASGFFILEYGSDDDERGRIRVVEAVDANGVVLDRNEYP